MTLEMNYSEKTENCSVDVALETGEIGSVDGPDVASGRRKAKRRTFG